MPKNLTISAQDVLEMDKFYREGGLRNLASPHIHYDDPKCPHEGCAQGLEWIDFQLELFGDLEGIYKPLVKAWWEGRGFAGHCPSCGGWIHFSTLSKDALNGDQVGDIPKLPDNWFDIAQVV